MTIEEIKSLASTPWNVGVNYRAILAVLAEHVEALEKKVDDVTSGSPKKEIKPSENCFDSVLADQAKQRNQDRIKYADGFIWFISDPLDGIGIRAKLADEQMIDTPYADRRVKEWLSFVIRNEMRIERERVAKMVESANPSSLHFALANLIRDMK